MSTVMPQFVPGPHSSHLWEPIDEPNWPHSFCASCEICTCHSPVASTEPCEYVVSPSTKQGTPDTEQGA